MKTVMMVKKYYGDGDERKNNDNEDGDDRAKTI